MHRKIRGRGWELPEIDRLRIRREVTLKYIAQHQAIVDSLQRGLADVDAAILKAKGE